MKKTQYGYIMASRATKPGTRHTECHPRVTCTFTTVCYLFRVTLYVWLQGTAPQQYCVRP
jgi:hypothetical protein